MIVAKAGEITIIGLSEGNIKNLKEGRPAVTEIPGHKGKVAIMYGKTEGAIYKILEKSGLKMPIPEIKKGLGSKI